MNDVITWQQFTTQIVLPTIGVIITVLIASVTIYFKMRNKNNSSLKERLKTKELENKANKTKLLEAENKLIEIKTKSKIEKTVEDVVEESINKLSEELNNTISVKMKEMTVDIIKELDVLYVRKDKFNLLVKLYDRLATEFIVLKRRIFNDGTYTDLVDESKLDANVYRDILDDLKK